MPGPCEDDGRGREMTERHGSTLFESVFNGYRGREFVLDVDIDVGRHARVAKITAIRSCDCPPRRKRLAAAYVRQLWSDTGPRLFFGSTAPEGDTLYVFRTTMTWDGGDTAEFRVKSIAQFQSVRW